jgi:N-acetylmuramoyl-L-alanine amidase
VYLMAYRVFIGVGHGGSDSGANKYVREKDANLTISLEM